MAIVDIAEIQVGRAEGGRVRLAIKGKATILDREGASILSNMLGNLAAEMRHHNVDMAQVEQVFLLPFREDGKAALRFMTNIGPMIVAIDSENLRALSAAADAALEHAQIAGRG